MNAKTAQGDFFPEIRADYDSLKEILDSEEASFARTLDRGEKLFQSYATTALEAGTKNLSGVDVWRLYDTYGFPVDLTLLMAEEMGLGVDQEAFEAAQAESKEISKRVKGGDGKVAAVEVKLDVHDIGKLEKMESVTKTIDEIKYSMLPTLPHSCDVTLLIRFDSKQLPTTCQLNF
jgi:alanyl-tRNA synthetase